MHQVWDRQRREWVNQKTPEHHWRFRPILPIIFYTGKDAWDTPIAISTLMDLPHELEPFVPHHQTLFFNLKASPPEELTASDHPFGWVLRVIQKETATQEELTEALRAAIDHLESLSPEEAGMWEKLMYYLVLLIYHRRDPSEHDVLIEQVRGRVRTHFRREEVENMGQTTAQALIQEGRELGAIQTKQEDLTMLLQSKFGQVPPTFIQRIHSISEIDRLNLLWNRLLTVNRLEDMEIE